MCVLLMYLVVRLVMGVWFMFRLGLLLLMFLINVLFGLLCKLFCLIGVVGRLFVNLFFVICFLLNCKSIVKFVIL